MIWTEKYKPTELHKIAGNSELVKALSSYSLETVPNIIFHGVSGVGKRTVVNCFIKHLFKTNLIPKIKKAEVKTTSKTIDVSYIEADEYIEISPSEYGYQDKLIIQTIIKEMGQTKPIMSLFSKGKKASLKIIVITSAEDLTQEAQAALRRTIEIYSSSFRIFLICSQLSKIIEPIRSRFLFYRLKALEPSEMSKILDDICTKESITVRKQEIDAIVKEAGGNLRRAITKLQLFADGVEKAEKRQKIDSSTKLDWEIIIDNIINKVQKDQSGSTVQEIRSLLYVLINSCVPSTFILNELYKGLIEKKDISFVEKVLNLSLKFEERILTGTKPIFHIEAFIIGVMCIIKKTDIPTDF